ncbi:MAG: hypothetical protein CMN75_13965 [Spirochaeta sp.]|nr:hypothetical protein [Spirochaeta sp.]RPG07803.1 MAG: sulfite exporter TauE/SafE family protein [Proteobacteria bacterium TMED72]
MTIDSHFYLYLAALFGAGVASGFAGGLFGLGGGILRVPVLLYLFPAFSVAGDHVFHLAAGTSLALAIPTCLGSVLRQRKESNLDVPLLKVWIPALLVGVAIGLLVSRVVGGSALRILFIVFLISQALYILIPNRPRISEVLPGRVVLSGVSSAVGGVSVLLGLSGGVMTTPILMAFGQSIHRAVAVSSAGGLALSVAATVGMIINGLGVSGRPAYSLGYIDLPAVALMIPAVLISSSLGVRVSNRIPARVLEVVFGVFLVGLIVDMVHEVMR